VAHRRVPPSEAPTLQPAQELFSGSAHASTFPAAPDATSPGAALSNLSTLDPVQADLRLAPGSVVAESFRVERELGRGAMGVVVLATHLALDRMVALKVHRAHNPADVSRLAREAKAMARVQHRNVVGIYDVREAAGRLFIAMEFVDGSSARHWLTRPGIAWRARLDMCLQAAAGLQAAHAAGLVHRDFKPENILIGTDGRVLVADFGLARAPGAVPIDPATPSPGVDAQLTSVGAITGTPAYMSPEQWHGLPVDARSDVFALSVVTYEALYGYRPFAGKTPPELAHTITHGIVLDPPENSEVPKAVFDVLRRGMQVDAGSRFGSVAMWTRALQSAVSAPGRTGVALALGLAAVVFGGIGAAAWALRARAPEPVALPEEELFEQPEAGSPEAPLAPKPAAIPAPPSEPPPPTPPPEPPPQEESAAGVDLDAASEHLEDVSERHRQGEATEEELIEATQALHAAMRLSRDGHYTTTPWSGTSTFVCGMGDRIELRDVKAKVAEGAAIEMELGCGLRLVNVDIEAPIAIKAGMTDRLVIEGGTFRVSRRGIMAKMLSVDIRDLTIEGDPLVAVELGMHAVGSISDSSFDGLTALRVGMHSRITLEGGRFSGKTALDAGMSSRVRVQGATLDGKVKRGPRARIEQ
jgi:predicted Ser/Thr protein kinase